MEDFSPIFWIVLVVGGLIYSAVSQARKAAGKEGRHPHPEAWPSLEPDEPLTSTTQRTEEATSYEEIFEDEGQSLEQIPEQEYSTPEMPQKTAYSKQFTSLQSATPEYTAAAVTNKETHDEIGATEIGAPTSIAEEFDLRRAVIETEILKPKFDE